MAMELPAAPRVYTTTYDNFKGVDYTNDSTNVWRRRSPTGYNMLPDASGRPFKRHGWEVVKAKEDFQALLEDAGVPADEFSISRCYYFTIGGVDVIFVFANLGVFAFKEEELTLLSTDEEIVQCFDRAYFFEGNGRSAFYIYGGGKVWSYDGEFAEEPYNFDGTGGVTIPTVLVGCSADCVGTLLQGYNLLGNYARVQYENNDLCFATTSTTSGEASVNPATFKTKISTRGNHTFSYDGSNWTYGGTNVTLSEYGISINGTFASGNTIVVHYKYGCKLPNNVAQAQVDEMVVEVSKTSQFSTSLPVVQEGETLTADNCMLHTDTVNDDAWIEFYGSYGAIVDGEDGIRITFPITEVIITPTPSDPSDPCVIQVTGQLGG